jgi:hypothetical protein
MGSKRDARSAPTGCAAVMARINISYGTKCDSLAARRVRNMDVAHQPPTRNTKDIVNTMVPMRGVEPPTY